MKMELNPKFALFLLLCFVLVMMTAYSSGSITSSIYSQQGTDSTSQNLSNNPGNSTDAQITLYRNNVYVVWTDDTTGNGDIYFKRSVNNGTTFGSTQNLSNNPGNSSDAQITLYRNNVYVVWTDDTTGNGDIYFKRSVNNGTTFGSTQNLSNNPGNSSDAQITLYRNNVYVVWTDDTTGDIYFKRSVYNGTIFGSTENLSNNSSGPSTAPQITAVANNVYVVWQDEVSGSSEIFLRASNNEGNKFSSIKNLSRNNTGDSITPRITSSGNSVFVVWTDSESGKPQIFSRASADKAGEFGGVKNVSWSSGRAYDPQIATGGNNTLYVLWEDTSFREFTFDLVMRVSTDIARTFHDKVNLGRYVGEISDYGQIAAYGNNVFVVWGDSPQYSYPQMYKIFLEVSRDNGKSFDDAINLSTGTGRSIDPQLAVSENDRSIFVVWSEITESNSDIQFTKLPNFF